MELAKETLTEFELLTRMKKQPYKEAIQCLKQISKHKTPIDKFRLFAESSNLIIEAINDHYKEINFPNKS